MKKAKKFSALLIALMLVISCFSGLGITASASTKADYYLCGYINGANYGVEEDYKNLGEYHFVDGTLTTSFTGVTWVGVKTADNSNWYFYDGKTGCTETTATLERDKSEKMFIPAGVEVTLTLTENADGTVTLSYKTGSEVPTDVPATTAPVTEKPTRPAPAGGTTANDYYLFGYINGANYGAEEDYQTLGEYYFTNGTLKTSFTGVTWVGVKTGDNKSWYLYDGKTGCTETTATLEKDKSEKMFIPAGVEVTLTLVVNADGTVTLSYETGAEVPTDAPATTAPVTEKPTRPGPAGGTTANDYYLFGYINGANYGAEEDYQTLGEYYFTNGTLKTSFTGVTWVGVKTGDNKNWYLYDGKTGCTETTATLEKDKSEKMFIPAGVEVTLTLVVNANGTVTLSYETGAEVPTDAPATTAPVTEKPTRPGPAGGTTANDYYLFGYINGANYGAEEDYQTLGEYYFTNGTLKTSFTGVTWVGVKTGDNKNWYLYDGKTGCTETTATLEKDKSEKMFIPAGVEVTLTLVVNANGTVTLSYETGAEVPTDAPVTTAPVTEKPTRPGPAGGTTANDYYLFGYINGENYGVEDDYQTLGEYYFTNGTLKTSFTGVTWVGVKTGDNKSWYLYDGETGCLDTTATLEKDKSEKMFIPAGVEVTLTLVVNADDTVTLSYETGEPITEPVTEEPTTQAPTTAEPTTQAPTTPVTVVPGFYLVGSAEVCGAEWNFMTPWDNLTPMSYIGNNVYTQTFTNIPSSANAIDSTGAHRYEFKVIYVDAKGGVTWHPGGSNNSTFVTVKDDGSTLKFTFKLLAASPTTEGQYPEAVTCEVTNPYAPTTAEPTTDAPTTAQPTTQAPTTAEPTTQAPTTAEPTTQAPTTAEPTTQAPTTAEPTTQAPTTAEPTTQAPTTAEPTTQAPTTAEPTTQAPTTAEPTTQAPTTAEPTTQAPTEAPKKDISGWKVEGLKNKTYTGKVIKQNIDVVSADGEYADITVEYRNNKNPGTATVTIKGTGNYTGTISKTFKISKAAQTMTVKAETKSVKAASVKKKNVTVTKAITVKKNKGTVTYARVKSGSSKYLTISKKGVITVKKGTYKKNTVLKIKVKVTAKGTTYYNKGSQTVTVKIKVK